MRKLNFLFILGLFFLASCGEQKPIEDQENQQEEEINASKKCLYSLKSDEMRVAWIAYKFTEKVGVNGKFDSISINIPNSSVEDPKKLLENIEVTVNANNISTYDNELRDSRIKKFFFGNMKTGLISGKIKNVTDTQLTISFKMNEIEKDVQLNYEISDTEVTANGEINVNDWEGAKGIQALNTECKDVHTGTDGLSVLHPDLKISFSIPIITNCK